MLPPFFKGIAVWVPFSRLHRQQQNLTRINKNNLQTTCSPVQELDNFN